MDIVNLIKKIISSEMKNIHTTELGIVTKLFSHENGNDNNNYSCNIKLRDSGLELQKVPVSSQRIGSVYIPNINDLVLVQFINANINSAVCTGRLYNNEDRPPEAKAFEHVYISPDKKDSSVRRLYFEYPNGNKVLIKDNEIKIESGKTKIKITNNGDIEIESNSNMNIKTQKNFSVDAKGDISLKSNGNLSLDAMGDIKVNGTNVNIKGKASTSVQAAGSNTIKGMNIKLGGMVDFSP